MDKLWRNLCLPLILVIATLSVSPAMAVEEPAFKLVMQDGRFAIRDYPALIAAQTHVEGDRQAAIGEGFRLIADYIFGNNRQK